MLIRCGDARHPFNPVSRVSTGPTHPIGMFGGKKAFALCTLVDVCLVSQQESQQGTEQHDKSAAMVVAFPLGLLPHLMPRMLSSGTP